MLLKKFSSIGFIFHNFVLFLPGKAVSRSNILKEDRISGASCYRIDF